MHIHRWDLSKPFRKAEWLNILHPEEVFYFEEELVKAKGGGTLLEFITALAFQHDVRTGCPARLEYDPRYLPEIPSEDLGVYFKGWKFVPRMGPYQIVIRNRHFWHPTWSWRIRLTRFWRSRALLVDGSWVELPGSQDSPPSFAGRDGFWVGDGSGSRYWVPMCSVVRVETKRALDIERGKVKWELSTDLEVK